MTRKSKKIISIVLTVSLMALILAGCAGGSDGDITIGVLVPTSGSEAYYGTDMLQSYELAVAEINESG